MAANGISTLQFKKDRQLAKLEIAEAKRQGRTVTAAEGDYTISGPEDPTKNYYRENNVLNVSLLPTLYADGNNNTNDVVNNPNADGLQQGRPWVSDIVAGNLKLEDGSNLLTENNETISLE